MRIAYNSAYVQTKTLNFTFARQAVIIPPPTVAAGGIIFYC